MTLFIVPLREEAPHPADDLGAGEPLYHQQFQFGGDVGLYDRAAAPLAYYPHCRTAGVAACLDEGAEAEFIALDEEAEVFAVAAFRADGVAGEYRQGVVLQRRQQGQQPRYLCR